jgi:hypothetical protein
VNLAWEKETAKALRAAQMLLALPDATGLGPIRAVRFPDPSAVMESIFRALLAGGPASVAGADLEPPFLSTPLVEPALGLQASETAPIARLTRGLETPPALDTPRQPPRASFAPVRTQRPAVLDRGAGQAGDRIAGRQDTETETWRETGPDAGRSALKRPDLTSATWRSASARERGDAWPAEAPLGERKRPGEKAAGPAAFREPHGEGQSGPASPAEAVASRSPRLVTELSNLQDLFRSVVTDSRSGDDRPSAQVSRGGAWRRDVSLPAYANAPPSGRALLGDLEPAPSGLGSAADRAPLAGSPESSVSLPAEPSPQLPGPAREEILLDRLADLMEERMRDLAIRHLGFTGGLT